MHFWVYRTNILFLENIFAAGCMSVVSSSVQTNKPFSKMFPTNMYFGAIRLVYRVRPSRLSFKGVVLGLRWGLEDEWGLDVVGS